MEVHCLRMLLRSSEHFGYYYALKTNTEILINSKDRRQVQMMVMHAEGAHLNNSLFAINLENLSTPGSSIA